MPKMSNSTIIEKYGDKIPLRNYSLHLLHTILHVHIHRFITLLPCTLKTNGNDSEHRFTL